MFNIVNSCAHLLEGECDKVILAYQASSCLGQETGLVPLACPGLKLSGGVTPTFFSDSLPQFCDHREEKQFLTWRSWLTVETDLTTENEKCLGRIRDMHRAVSGLIDWPELSLVGELELATLVHTCGDGDLNGLGTEACFCHRAEVVCKRMSECQPSITLCSSGIDCELCQGWEVGGV